MNYATASERHSRRQRLARTLPETPVLLAAGGLRGRNYAANPYPYRASSHFLYLAGEGIPGAYLLVNGEQHLAFLPKASDDDALWHGPSPSHDDWAERLGCPVRPLAELPLAIPPNTATLVPSDPAATLELEVLLGRSLEAAHHTENDARLRDAMIELRLRHDEAAQRGLRAAADSTVTAHKAGMRATRPGRHEWEIKAAMEHAIGAHGLTTSYPPIVTVHGEILHNHHYANRLALGDILLADVGAESHDGWAGDVTRSWPVSGTFDGPQREIYTAVLRAQKAAIACCRPGVRYRDVHLSACHSLAEDLVALGILQGDPASLVADGVHALFFPHGVGHLLGLDVHDMEDLGDHAGYGAERQRDAQFGLSYLRLDRDLEAGMAVTIEPGFYQVPALLQDPKRRAAVGDRVSWDQLSKFASVRGIRIEDDILITAKDPQILTADAPRDLDELQAAVGDS